MQLALICEVLFSQGIAATDLRCGENCDIRSLTDFILFIIVKKSLIG